MAFGISSKARVSPIAVDFGADAVKMLQVVNDDTPEPIAAGCAVLPEDARSHPQERLLFIEEAVKGMLRNLPFRGRRVICAIPGFQTLIHNFMIPRTDPEDIDALIDLQLAERLGVVPSRMILKNFHAADHHRRGAARSDVICLAVKRELVMQYLGLVGRCRLEVVGMHVEPLCVTRCFESTLERSRGATCFIDLGAATTKVIVTQGSKLLLVKTIHAAGDHWTQLHARHAKLEFDEARRERLAATASGQPVSFDAPLPGPSESAEGFDPALQAESATATATAEDEAGPECPAADPNERRYDEVLRTLIDELRLVLRHHRGRHAELPIHRVLLLGGEANRPELRQRLSDALDLPCDLGDAFAEVGRELDPAAALGVDVRKPQPNWAVAMGLCLSEANL